MIPHRKTLRRFENPGDVRFLTFSCHRRMPLLGTPVIRDEFAAHLETVHTQRAFRLITWVIMPEHVHLLLIPSLPEWPVPRILNELKRPFARRVIQRWRELDAPILSRLVDRSGRCRLWLRGGGYDRNIYSEGYLRKIIEYIHLNPVRRELVADPIAWRWSSARWFAGVRTGAVVTIDPLSKFV